MCVFPFLVHFLQSVQSVLSNLLISHIELRSDESPDIRAYSHQRNVEKVVVPLGEILSAHQARYLQVGIIQVAPSQLKNVFRFKKIKWTIRVEYINTTYNHHLILIRTYYLTTAHFAFTFKKYMEAYPLLFDSLLSPCGHYLQLYEKWYVLCAHFQPQVFALLSFLLGLLTLI